MALHLGPNGPAKCTATKRPCPIGGEHFDTISGAEKAYSEKQGGTFPVSTVTSETLDEIYNQMKDVEDVEDLSPELQKFVESVLFDDSLEEINVIDEYPLDYNTVGDYNIYLKKINFEGKPIYVLFKDDGERENPNDLSEVIELYKTEGDAREGMQTAIEVWKEYMDWDKYGHNKNDLDD
jgi:hypothetical protein